MLLLRCLGNGRAGLRLAREKNEKLDFFKSKKKEEHDGCRGLPQVPCTRPAFPPLMAFSGAFGGGGGGFGGTGGFGQAGGGGGFGAQQQQVFTPTNPKP
jgi:hypothetical protein